MKRPVLLLFLSLLLAIPPARAHGGRDFVVVNTTADSGSGSLREAIMYANDDADTQISFQIPTTDKGYDRKTGVFTIQLKAALPWVEAKGTVFDGLAQTLVHDSNKSGPEIRLSGKLLPRGSHGLILRAANCEIKGLIISDFPGHGVILTTEEAKNCRVQSNVIEKNRGCGVVVSYGAAHNWIGIAPPPEKPDDDDDDFNGIYAKEQGNVIRANGEDGVRVVGEGTEGNSVRGNDIIVPAPSRQAGYQAVKDNAS